MLIGGMLLVQQLQMGYLQVFLILYLLMSVTLLFGQMLTKILFNTLQYIIKLQLLLHLMELQTL